MIRALVTDIEGTTSAIRFVVDELFPYAAKHLPAFVRQHAQQAEVAALLADVAAIAQLDVDDQEALIQQLLDWIASDQKITPLKSLQGLIWQQGYVSGELRGHVYADAAEQLQRWHAAGLQLAVYSSGSVAAQKLLFAHSTAGDLTPLFSAYFDTHIGAKTHASSYQQIATALNLPAEAMLFLSDIAAELSAARQAGFEVIGLNREGKDVDADFRWVDSFAAIGLLA